MTQPMARILTATALLVAALASLARAEDILLWTSREDGGLVSLSYGSFDPGTIPIFMVGSGSAAQRRPPVRPRPRVARFYASRPQIASAPG